MKLVYIFSLITLLGACSLKQTDETSNWSASKLYSEAREDLLSGDYETALKNYERLQARYPYSNQARQAEIETIYAYYKYGELDSAIAAIERFINEHPDHPNLDYVYYMRGIMYYTRGQDMLAKIFPQDPAQRDPETLKTSFKYFSELVNLFPKSQYTPDALERLNYLRNKLAEHELHVARFYFNREAYVAAINRAKVVVENFQRTSSVPEALHIIKDSYTALGANEAALRYDRLIKANDLEKYQRITRDSNQGIIEAITK